MKHYIDKDALVAEIKKIEEQNPHIQHGDMLVNRDRSIRCNLLEDLLEFLDTLEVKEVDLEHEINKVKKMQRNFEIKNDTIIDFCAKHFFELGLKAQKGE